MGGISIICGLGIYWEPLNISPQKRAGGRNTIWQVLPVPLEAPRLQVVCYRGTRTCGLGPHCLQPLTTEVTRQYNHSETELTLNHLLLSLQGCM